MKKILSQININELVKEAEESGIDPDMATSVEKAPAIKAVFLNIQVAIIYLLGVAIVGTIVYGGIVYMTAGGNGEQAEKGKKIITGAIIAGVIAMVSYSFYNFLVGIW
ncbi:MAG: hypothetical protein BWY43_00648 [candidate division WS2 bacterium ADurb.Bin280]|uniref:TrbC/VIRB2 family protein n=1 Tax=candidate division WS2 bacterium ADurb.Bin280 TaxID=1852829 RepID=A0A1V5SD32_9BACT|nr:MAG: hypothetical protein BWY43_00648 [candidate division WS2 bacterium ADurb.Bin280]